MKLILGSMTFSDQTDEPTSLKMLEYFVDQGYSEVDTAYQYNAGKTEQLLGKLTSENSALEIAIATKVNPWDGNGLQAAEIRKQFPESLNRLRAESVDMLYLHAPDLDTPVRETLEVIQEYFEQGKFRRFALSNFAAWQVAEAVEICRANNWIVPTVYQGMYNALTRDVERELFACLRNYGISFYVYNPLAGGLLTGKHKNFESTPEPGRFSLNEQYAPRYWKQDYFQVLDAFTATCADYGMSPTEAALAWLVHHSGLSEADGDGIILGASRFEHLEMNMQACGRGPLPADILTVLDEGWEVCRPNCFKYFRP